MTLLSFGNSSPDLALNCALAKAGYGEMGLAGSIAGPLFNLLMGLGMSLIKNTIERLYNINIVKLTVYHLIYSKIIS
jgi:sodium/potassium/calcium exchanger 6